MVAVVTARLPDGDEGRARAYVDAVADRLARVELAQQGELSLLAGVLGHAVFWGELASWGRAGAAERGSACVERAVELFNERGAPEGLHEGIAGLGFVVARWYPQHGELLPAIDEALVGKVRRLRPDVADIGLRSGYAGLIRYALERGEAGHELLGLCVDALEARARRVTDGLFWPSTEDYVVRRGLPPQGGRWLADFGVAHGQAGLVHALAGVLAVPALEARARALLRPALSWLWSQASVERPELGCLWVDGGPAVPLNVDTWCTGNPGVAGCAYFAAAALEEGALAGRALALADTITARVLAGARPGLPGRADLCCGTAGVAAVLAGLFAATGRGPLGDAAARVAGWTLDDEARDPLPGLGLQFGPPGVALLLVGLLGGPTGWGRAFCLGPP